MDPEQVRTAAPGSQATTSFAAALPSLAAESQIGLVRALADRGDAAARPHLLPLLDATNSEIRVAALDALGYLGSPDDVDRLWQFTMGVATAEATAARHALERITAEAVNPRLVAQLPDATVPQRVMLIEILSARRAKSAVPELLTAAVGDDAEVRTAAMAALGQLGEPGDLAGMVKGVLRAARGPEQVAAEKAVMFVCQRIEDPQTRAAPLAAAIRNLKPAERLAMLTTLARVGGDQARQDIDIAIASKNAAEHAAGLRAIANWPDASIAPRLIELIQTDAHPDHRTLVLRALIRVAVLPDDRSDADRLGLLKEAMGLCQRDAERLFVLQRAQAIRTVETLQYVLPYVKQPEFMETACLTIVELAHHRKLRDDHKDQFFPALDLVIATSQNATTVDRATRYKNNQTWVRK